MAQYTVKEALHPSLHRRLDDMGLPEQMSLEQIHAWQETRPRRSIEAMLPDAEQILNQLVDGASLGALAAERQLTPSRLLTKVERAVMFYLADHLHHLPAWRSQTERGVPVATVAGIYQVSPALVTLALQGVPRTTSESEQLLTRARELWQDGASAEEIADQLSCSVRRVRVWQREGTLGEERISASELEARYRWASGHNRVYRAQQILPSPDSPPDQHRVWWWASTIADLERATLLHACPQCRGRYPSARALAIHTGLAHPDASTTGT